MEFAVSEKQSSFIAKLLAERMVSEDLRREINMVGGSMTSRQASNIITDLLNCQLKVQAPAGTPVTVPGMYGREGVGIFRVKIGRQSGRPYAMRLSLVDDKITFEYDAGAIRMLVAEDRWTLEQAKEFGLETGFCCVCGAFLTDPKSVEAGIGPVCAKKV